MIDVAMLQRPAYLVVRCGCGIGVQKSRSGYRFAFLSRQVDEVDPFE